MEHKLKYFLQIYCIGHIRLAGFAILLLRRSEISSNTVLSYALRNVCDSAI